MSDFYQGFVSSIAILSGLCAFIYWVLNLMEKRIELKIETLGFEIKNIAEELKEERRSKDYLYKFVIDNVDKK